MSRGFDRSAVPYGDEACAKLIPAGAQRVLDFGCRYGDFLAHINRGPELYGCDIDAEAIEEAKRKVPNGHFRLAGLDAKIPFEDSSFDVVTLLSVLEHVPDEQDMLAEIHRVLRPDGRVIILVPHTGLFEFADPGNVKFRFPTLHKFIHTRLFGKDMRDYARKFEDAEGTGVVGCHSNRWHTHYSKGDLTRLFGANFELEATYGFCMFAHILSCFDTASSLLFKPSSPLRKLVRKVEAWDNTLQPESRSAFILVSARRKNHAQDRASPALGPSAAPRVS